MRVVAPVAPAVPATASADCGSGSAAPAPTDAKLKFAVRTGVPMCAVCKEKPAERRAGVPGERLGKPEGSGVVWSPVCGDCGDEVEAGRLAEVAGKLKDFVPVEVEEAEAQAAAAASAAARA